MVQITAQMRVLVAIESVDGRKGIDSLARLCQEKLAEDPFSGCVFVQRWILLGQFQPQCSPFNVAACGVTTRQSGRSGGQFTSHLSCVLRRWETLATCHPHLDRPMETNALGPVLQSNLRVRMVSTSDQYVKDS
jgi:hypothetical protein